MLYRPCLIKLNAQYHLREQQLPFFITLAHELLHVLNQLERLQEIVTNHHEEFVGKIIQSPTSNYLADSIDTILTIQAFLKEKLGIKDDDLCLEEHYKALWQNGEIDDSLDEMSVILGCNRKISPTEEAFIGETTFYEIFTMILRLFLGHIIMPII